MRKIQNDLTKRIFWLIIIRWIAVFLSIFIVIVKQGLGSRSLGLDSRFDTGEFPFLPFLILFVISAMNIIYFFITNFVTDHYRFAFIQILVDVFLASCLIYATGGANSPFTFLFFASVLAASFIFGLKTSVFFASLSTAFLMVITIIPLIKRDSPEISGFFESIPIFIAQGAAYHLVAFLSGVLSARLKQTRHLYDQILEDMTEGVLSIDQKGNLTFINATAKELLGLGMQADYSGQGIAEVLDKSINPMLKFVILGKNDSTVEVTLTPKGRKPLPVSITTSNLVDEKGKNQGVVVILGDLSERKKMEQSLKQVEKLEAVSEMAATIAHEIRNPLSSIRGAAQELQERLQGSDSEYKLLDVMVRESDRLDKIITEFLRYARMPQIKPVRCQLKNLLNDVVLLLSRGSGSVSRLSGSQSQTPTVGTSAPENIGIQLSILDDLCCRADFEQLKQVFLNLGLNAIEAMDGKGALKIVVSEVVSKDVGAPLMEISESPEDKFAKIDFIDSGEGIPPENIAKVFDPFFTTKAKGTGLGLSIAQRIIEAHDGSIIVKSRPGQGARFSVFLKSVL